MKVCPICSAASFDDATTCYGCLHRFEEGEGRHRVAPATEGKEKEGTGVAATVRSTTGMQGVSASFLISILPFTTEAGEISWHCDVKPQCTPKVMPGQVRHGPA